jgi:hypothetical protein
VSGTGSVKPKPGTAVTVTGLATTVPNILVVQAVALDNDSASAAFSDQVNPNLASIVERSDDGTT